MEFFFKKFSLNVFAFKMNIFNPTFNTSYMKLKFVMNIEY